MADDITGEGRRSERRIVRVRARLRLHASAQEYYIRTENVSAGGVAVRMPVALPKNTSVALEFSIAGPSRANIMLSASVVHTLLSDKLAHWPIDNGYQRCPSQGIG